MFQVADVPAQSPERINTPIGCARLYSWNVAYVRII